MFTTFVVSEPKKTEPKKTEPKKTMITLVSKEGFKFQMERRAAKMINVLKPLLNDEENEEFPLILKEFRLRLTETAVLEKVIEYCNYHSGLIAKTTGNIETDWDTTFLEGIIGESRTMLFDLLRAANYLDIKSLLDLTCVKVASMIQKDIGGDLDTIDLIDTLPVEMQLEIYSHRTYAQHAELADKIQAQSTALGETKAQSTALGETIELRTRTMARDGVRVPQDCNTLKEAVALVESVEWRGKYANYAKTFKEKRFPTIVLGKGVHKIDQEYSLKITSAMNIVGDPEVDKSEIEVVGGIRFYGGIQGNCHLQHLTLRQARYVGVRGDSSFTMEDVLVEQCRYYGVWAQGTGGVGRCTNVEVRYCGLSGVAAGNGASITLIGANTTVHHNCWRRGEVSTDEYGLKVYGSSSSTIQLVFPLTKEQVSIDNGGGDNWGAGVYADINQIKTIAAVEERSKSK